MIYSQLPQWNVKNKRVFVRADLNVPLDNGCILNDFRLKNILPTINYILEQQGTIILATHIGRPEHSDPSFSTQLLVPWFEKQGYTITFVPNLTNISHYMHGIQQILLLENLRFFPGEKTGDPFFAKQLAQTADYYVNDAFGDIHHNDTSIALLPYEFTESRRTIGFLMEKELRILDTLHNNPEHPFVAIIGGGKITDKIPLIHGLLATVDTLILCPAICFSFLKAEGLPVGKSLVDDTTIKECTTIMHAAQDMHKTIIFPIDYQIAHESINGELSIIDASNFPDDAVGISIGPKTVALITTEINKAKIIFLNCAMGFTDRPETCTSTDALIQAMALSTSTTVIAGGDSVQRVFNAHQENSINHLSTGGGAALAYLSGNLLPGLIPFEEE
jgi:phosphoglycerate kinase